MSITLVNTVKVDDRATILTYLTPESVDVADGPTMAVASGFRVNADMWPSASGT